MLKRVVATFGLVLLGFGFAQPVEVVWWDFLYQLPFETP